MSNLFFKPGADPDNITPADIKSKKSKRKTPSARTIEYLRSKGYLVDIVERFNSFAGQFGQRKDLFGFLDLIALAPNNTLIGVQVTGVSSNHIKHRRKIVGECGYQARRWLECGGRIQIWSWNPRKRKKGGVAITYKANIEELTLKDFSNGSNSSEAVHSDMVVKPDDC